MNRETFLERLSFMQDYTIIPDEFYEFLGFRKKHPKRYSAGTDSRFSSYLGYASAKDQGHGAYLSLLSFSIAANLSDYCLQQPDSSQLSEMLQISGYTPEQMEEYARELNGLEPERVPSHQLQPAVFLLTHVLNDTLADESEWQGMARQKSGKKTAVNPSLIKLRNLVSYMAEHGLLDYSDIPSKESERNAYENFAVHHAEAIIKKECITNEMDQAFQQLEERRDKMKEERDRAIVRFLKNLVKPAVMNAPLANPAGAMLSAEERMALNSVLGFGEPMPQEEIQSVIDRCKGIMPPESLGAIENYEHEYDELMDVFDRIHQNADAANDAITADQENRMRCESLPTIAKEAFQAILDGDDEIYKLKAGRYIWQDFITQSKSAGSGHAV